jgi:hypothetical protein
LYDLHTTFTNLAPRGVRFRFIDYYENVGEGVQHYAGTPTNILPSWLIVYGFPRRGYCLCRAKKRTSLAKADKAVIRRVKSIGIPPAYEFVWICSSANGHIQATGLDARGRKQYRYHPKWRELRDQNKYEHILQFAAALPALRCRVASDMKRDGLPREKVLATIVSLLEKTLIRVGRPNTPSRTSP